MKYAIGLDIGIASVGYAVLGLNEQEEPWGILRMGSRIFDEAENPKDGSSLALPRRQARSMRRRLRRKRHRRERIRQLILSEGLLTEQALDSLFTPPLEDIYALRVRGLDEPLSPSEFARVLIHLCQRRGFRSNRKSAAADKETGALLKAVQENQNRMQQNGYRTVGEMLYRDELFRECKRNKGENYLATVQRDSVEAEARLLFESQRRLGCSFASQDFETRYLDILLSQRSFEAGPGPGSPYGGNQVEKMVGRCVFEPDEPRAAKACYTFEYADLLQRVNHIRILENGKSVPLTADQRNLVVQLAHKKSGLTYADLRKELGLSPTQLFNTVRYGVAGQEECEKKEKLRCMRAWHILRKALDKVKKGRLSELNLDQRDAIGTALTYYKSDAPLTSALLEAGLTAPDVDALLAVSGFSGFGHLSLKASRKLIPYLEQGLIYSDACQQAGYDFQSHKSSLGRYLPANPQEAPELEDIVNPVVRRAVSQTIKVVNAIIREQGDSPVYLNIELARELNRSKSDRDQMDRDMKANSAVNERIMDRLREDFGITNPTGQDLVKLKLYEQQEGVCAYSLKNFDCSRLFEPGYAEVDHIIPYSISFDDSYKNKVLVFAAENRQKGNRLPLEYMTGEQRDNFIVWTKSSHVRDFRKKQNLLKEHLTEDELNSFNRRNLQDTQYLSRFLYNFIRDHLAFAPSSTQKKRRVNSVKGAVTSQLRSRWGLAKVRANGDTHHAVDAVVIGCTTPALLQKVSRYSLCRETRFMPVPPGETAPVRVTDKEPFPAPWPGFRRELEARLSEDAAEVAPLQNPAFYSLLPQDSIKPIFVSRMPRHKATGAAHKETIKSKPDCIDENLVVVKRPLTQLKLDKNGQIANYYMPQSDTLLYEALCQRLRQFGNDGAKAFAEPFHKPKSDGTPGPVVKKVKLLEAQGLGVSVLRGTAVADNDSMVRIDIFYIPKDGYYMVPIYVADTIKPQLPQKAVVAKKKYSEWPEMDSKDFLFSLYPNDLIRVEHKKMMTFTVCEKQSTLQPSYQTNAEFVYYSGADISSACIKVVTHDHSYEISGLGIKTLKSLKKYQVDALGNITPVNREPRLRFR